MAEAREILRFQVQREGRDFKVRRFKTEKEGVYYKFPATHQSKDLHKKLFAYTAIVAAEKDCPNDSNYRHISVKMLASEAALYVDEAGNPIFDGITLEEDEIQKEKMKPPKQQQQQPPDEQLNRSDPTHSLLLQRLIELENKLKEAEQANLADIEKKFTLNRFDGSEQAKDWLEKFESECNRFGVTDADRERRVELLGKMISSESTAKNWFDINRKNLDGDSYTWSCWKSAFLKVFAIKNWKPVREAHYLKYSSGPLVEYALAKDLKLLNADPGASATSRINSIVMGLPEFVQDQLPRGALNEVNDLLEKLAALPEPFTNKVRGSEKNSKREIAEPCPYCKSKGFKKRFHRLEDCRTKKQDEESEKAARKSKAKVNLAEQTSSTDGSSDEDKKEIGSSLNW